MLKVPTIHLNGTSKADLQDAVDNAALALGEALRALQAASPNGRDYYPQGPEAFGQAQAEHWARLQKLQTVREELNELQIAIHDGGHRMGA